MSLSRSKERWAFTLIELLVVIAIIAILAAILFPVFAQAREKARQSSCISNEKQLGLACLMYSGDYDETMPMSGGWDPGIGGWANTYRMCVPIVRCVPVDARARASMGNWFNSTQPYVKNYGLITCPSGINTGPWGGDAYNKGLPRALVSVTYNGLLQSYTQAGIVTPANLPLVTEGTGKASIDGFSLAFFQLSCPDATLPCRYQPCGTAGNGGSSMWFGTSNQPTSIHAGVQNVGLADGHVKARRVGGSAYGSGYDKDFWTGYNTNDVPLYAWTDGCHGWLFRPDVNWQ